MLLEKRHKLGGKGSIVSVKPGFARNFLFSNGLAVPVDKAVLRMQNRLLKEQAEEEKKDLENAQALAAQVEGKKFIIELLCDDEGQLFGSVNIKEVVQILDDEGIKMVKEAIRLGKPIKQLGSYVIPLVLHDQVRTEFTLEVLKKES